MRGLQLLIIVMTTLLFVGMGVLAYGLATGNKIGVKPATPPPVRDITLPPSSKIEKISPWRDGVALHVTAPKGEFIYFVNATGGIAATLVVKRAPDAVPAAQ